jgi:spermidine/putrescine transport system permease protein
VTVRRVARDVWPAAVVVAVLAFLYGPAIATFVLSLNTGLVTGFPIRGLTVHWYTSLWTDSQFRDALLLSIKVAALATLIAICIGAPAAISISRANGRIGKALAGFYMAPLLVPPLVFAIAAATALRLANVRLSFWTLVAGHVVLTAPIMYLFVSARLRGFDWTLPSAARVLGASPRQAFVKVTAPLLAPAVAGGAILAFAISMDNFVVSLFLSAGQTTLPLLIWSRMREFFDPTVNAMASLFIAFTLGAAVVAERLISGRGSPIKQGDVQ